LTDAGTNCFTGWMTFQQGQSTGSYNSNILIDNPASELAPGTSKNSHLSAVTTISLVTFHHLQQTLKSRLLKTLSTTSFQTLACTSH